MSFPDYGNLTLRKRPAWLDDRDFMNSLLKVGPDVQPQPVQFPQPAPLPQMPAVNNNSPTLGQGLGQGLGSFAGSALERAMKTRSPDLKPQPGGNPLGDLPQKSGDSFLGGVSRVMDEGLGGLAADGIGSAMKTRSPDLKPQGGNPLGGVQTPGGGRHKFLGLFKDGGTLRKPGDVAVVGDAGPEVALRKPGGETEIIPLGGRRSFAEMVRDIPVESFRPPQPEQPAGPQLVAAPGYQPGSLLQKYAADNPQGLAPATRPRTATPQPASLPRGVAGLTALAQGQGQPVSDEGSSLLAASPSPVPPTSRARRVVEQSPEPPYDPPTVPMAGKIRAQPAPGEESANNSRFMDALRRAGLAFDDTLPVGDRVAGGPAPEGVSYSDFDTRRPWVTDRLGYDETHVPNNRNGRVRGALISAGLGAIQGALSTPQNPIAGMVGGALGAGSVGAFRPQTDEAMRHEMFTLPRERAERAAAQGAAADALKLADAQAGVRLKNAQADYTEQRPEIEAAKARESARKSEEARIFGILRSLRGQKIDPSNPRYAKLLADADAADIPIDAESFNNSKGNVVRFTRTDAEHPERTQVVERNVVTGEEKALGQGAFQATRNAEGMTAAEVRTDEDRDRGYNALERQRAVSNELTRAGLNLSRERFDFTKLQRDDRLSENTRKEMSAAAKMRADAEQAQMDAESFKSAGMYVDDNGKERQAKWAAQKWKAAEDKAEAKRREYFQTYGYLHSPDGGEMRMTMDEFRQLFPNAPNPMASAPSYGVVITDSTQPGTPHTNNYPPRRGAPRAAGSTGRKYTEAEVRERARAQGKNEDEAVRAVRAKNMVQ